MHFLYQINVAIMQFIVIAFLLFLVFKECYGIKCYICGYTSSDIDRSCLTISESTPFIDCPLTYCTIMRQEYLDPPGVVASFIRNCEQSPIFLNHETQDSTFKSYYRACTSDFCNVGDGIQSVTGGNLSPSPRYEGPNLLVPGTGNSATKSRLSLFLLITAILCLSQ